MRDWYRHLYVNKHDVTGIVYWNPKDLRNAMETLLKDLDLAKKMGKNAKIRAKKLFADKQSKSYLKIYEEVLNN